MDGRPTWTDCDEAGDYVVPNVFSPRDLVFKPDNMDETVPHTSLVKFCLLVLKILSGNKILTSIKGRNSVANLRNLTLYNPNLDIIYVNVYTKFG